MSSEKLNYAALIVDLEAKRETLVAAIGALKAAVAAGALSASEESGSVVQRTAMPNVPTTRAETPDRVFTNKSIADAAIMHLGLVKKKQTTREIADALIAGGIKTRSSRFVELVGTVLSRRKKQGEVVRADDYWVLKSWQNSESHSSALRNFQMVLTLLAMAATGTSLVRRVKS